MEAKRVVLAFLDRLNAKDHEGMFALTGEDLVWVVKPQQSLKLPPTNKRAQKAVMKETLIDAFKEFKVTPTTIVAEGEQVAVEMFSKATFNDGRPYGQEYFMLFVVKDGLIRRVHEFADSDYSLKQFKNAEWVKKAIKNKL